MPQHQPATAFSGRGCALEPVYRGESCLLGQHSCRVVAYCLTDKEIPECRHPEHIRISAVAPSQESGPWTDGKTMRKRSADRSSKASNSDLMPTEGCRFIKPWRNSFEYSTVIKRNGIFFFFCRSYSEKPARHQQCEAAVVR